jgi:hypothetical protein
MNKKIKQKLFFIRRYNPDLYIASFPKSGRTWHRVILGSYYCLLKDLDLKLAAEPQKIALKHKLPYAKYTHDGANFDNHHAPDDPSVAPADGWNNKPVIIILRDIRDTLTSAYFHAHFRQKVFVGSISEFIRQPSTGADKILSAWSRWEDALTHASRSLVITYEDMHRDTVATMESTLNFIGITPVDHELLSQAIDFSKADNLRKLERNNFFESGRLRTEQSAPKEAMKVRSATIGDHQNHLSAEDLTYIAEREDVYNHPFRASFSSGL